MNFWTIDEFNRILTASEDDPTAYVSFLLLYYSGIRFGEFLALTPQDFDFSKNTLNIDKSLQRVKKQDVITPPKTEKSIRTIIMPDFVMNEVKNYMSKLYDLKETDRVFPFTKSFINNAMAQACKKSSVKRIRIHDIRYPNQNKIQTFMVKAVCTLFFLSIKVWILFLLLRFSKSAEFN